MSNPTVHAANEMSAQLIEWRRRLHAQPELSGNEAQTAAFVADTLRSFGYEPRERVGGMHGVVAELRVGDAPFVALRADTDALPIEEETGLDFASTVPGVMHACGHDAHTAMLLGAAQLLKERAGDLRRSVRFIFQPHEESMPGGAPAMIAGGVLENVEQIFGIHICSNVPYGQIATRVGPFMAAVNTFDITVRGQGGHAAMPETCRDPIVAAANIVSAFQTIVSRSIPVSEPAVVSVTQFHSGTAYNVIPPEAVLKGTIRTFSDEVQRAIGRRVREIAENIANAHGSKAEVRVDPGYPVLVNDATATREALQAATDIGFSVDSLTTLDPQGGGEDFSYYCRELPGAFVFLGARNEAKDCIYPHHHPRFNVDEDALPQGVALHAQFALNAGAVD